jgi:hypothetical protein
VPDAFARKERKVPERSRKSPPSPASERTTVACACGVIMTLAWRTAEPVKCFGCGRTFAPPPTATAAPLRWRPDLAFRPSRWESRWRGGPVVPIALATSIAAVLLLLVALAVRLAFVHP